MTGTVVSAPVLTGEVAMEVALRLAAGQKLPRVVATPQAPITKDTSITFWEKVSTSARHYDGRWQVNASQAGRPAQLTLMNVQAFYQHLATGLIIFVAMMIDRVTRGRG